MMPGEGFLCSVDLRGWLIQKRVVALVCNRLGDERRVESVFNCRICAVRHGPVDKVRSDIGTVARLERLLLLTASRRLTDRFVRWMTGA